MPVMLYDGVEALDVTRPVGVLAGANAYLAATAPRQPGYRIATASPGRSAVESLSGVTLTGGSAPTVGGRPRKWTPTAVTSP
ncbi:hypothetical protein GCM10010493_08720 [Streptomyces lavendulae subsp. grasserius]